MGGTRNPVVVGVDGSAASHGALRWAADEAAVRGLPLRVLHAVCSAEPECWATARAMIAEAVGRARARQAGITVTGEVIDGQPVTELCAASAAAEMVVLAGRGAGGFEELLLGSVSSQVALHAHSAVTVVHGTDPAADQAPVEHSELPVLVGADSSAESEKAIGVAFAEAAARGVALVAIRAWRSQPVARQAPQGSKADRSAMEIAAHYAVSEALAGWLPQYPSVKTEIRIVTEGPAAALVAASRAAQLLVVGSKGNASLAGLRLGATTHQLLHHAQCPIIIVRCDEERQPTP